MTTGGGSLPRRGVGLREATYLELFFDVVFVFALTRISQRLVDDFTSERRIVLPEAGATALLLLALWLVWSFTALVASRFDPERPAMQLLIVGVMFGGMVMAVALPDAFGRQAAAFAGAYVAIQLGRPLALAFVQRGEQQDIPARLVIWSAASAAAWIGGLIAPQGMPRVVLWTLALAVDYLGLMLGWPAPRHGRSRIHTWALSGEHLAERYRQFVIIALGESILLTGMSLSREGVTADRMAPFVTSFATSVLLWRIYSFRAGLILREAAAAASRPARLSLSSLYTHLVIVTGVVATAVGYDLMIGQPYGQTDPAWLAVILGGPALFLAGRGRLEYEVFGRVSRSRVIGVLVLATSVPGLLRAPALAVAVAATLVLAGVSVSDALRTRRNPAEPPSPPL